MIFFHNFIIIILSRVYKVTNQFNDLQRCTGIARGQGFESHSSLNVFFFRLSFHNCKSCVYNCDDLLSYNSSPHSSHIWFSFITSSSSFNGFITSQFNDLLPVDLLAQLVECYTGVTEVKGSNTVQAWTFFRLSFHNCKSCIMVSNCDDLVSYNSSPRSSHLWSCFITSSLFCQISQNSNG